MSAYQEMITWDMRLISMSGVWLIGLKIKDRKGTLYSVDVLTQGEQGTEPQ